MSDRQLLLSKIENGIVIDHIPAAAFFFSQDGINTINVQSGMSRNTIEKDRLVMAGSTKSDYPETTPAVWPSIRASGALRGLIPARRELESSTVARLASRIPVTGV